jgi:hypothetical protein
MARVDGQVVSVGNYVGFKSDIEQGGRIVGFSKTLMGSDVLILENLNGFEGDYIGGDTRTQVLASECWLE